MRSPAELPDILRPGLKIVFCGINPGLGAAAGGRHFIGKGNRFWKVLHLAGFTPEQMRPDQDSLLMDYGCGLTTAVSRPSARAADLSKSELVAAASDLRRKVEAFAPEYIAFLGKAAYGAMVGQPGVTWGRQRQVFGGAVAWVLTNPSGLNRGYSIEDLVKAYAELRIEAGLSDRRLGRAPETRLAAVQYEKPT
ncbi:G/U mismatch-specific DNA glycosylase [Tardiphaga robiniae]|uniref:G/U mismatch-specific DNA glycosylase n=1 Tax=Tardiphaga robiniae TaxID=943830 RepID=A0A7G6U8D7_9BRAD|nr:G/U mismatch-specific DNA glycosylase [Tardiphaga robiniae]